jgi:hypothetical protein
MMPAGELWRSQQSVSCPYSPKLPMALAEPPRNHENGATAKAIFILGYQHQILRQRSFLGEPSVAALEQA